MFPKINIYGKEISTYAICAAVGLGFCILLMHFLIKNRRDVYKACLGVMAVFAGVGMFIGAHIVYTITRIDAITELFNHWDYYMSSWDKALMMLGSIFGGMVFYGGLFGGLGGAALYCRIKKLSFLHYADIFAPVIPLFHAFGRIGCLMAGCCYGIESEFGFHTTPHVEGVADVSRFPVQLVECFGNILIMAVLVTLSDKRVRKGTILGTYFVLYPALRFTDEFFRGDTIRGLVFGLSTSQWISILAFILGVVMILRRTVLPCKTKYEFHLPIGQMPEGYIYNKYAGAVPPMYQHLLINRDADEASAPTEKKPPQKTKSKKKQQGKQ